MHIGNRLKKIRNLKGVSQSKVCKGIVSPSHYSNIESGRYEASEDILELIAKRLQIPSNYLIHIHEESLEIAELLTVYNKYIETDLSKANYFLEQKQKQLEYIQSINQEVKFLLLNCLHQLKNLKIQEAKKIHDEVSYYIQDENIGALSSNTQFKFYYVSGLLMFYKRKYLESYELYNKALQFSSFDIEKAKILFNLALICYQINDIQKALIFAQDAKTCFMDHHKWVETVESYNLLGILYSEIKEFEKGLEVMNKGLSLASDNKMYLQEAKILHNFGSYYLKIKEFDNSIDYYKKSLDIKHVYDPNNVFVTYLAILNILLEKQDFRQLKLTLSEAYEYVNTTREKYQLIEIEAEMEFLLFNYDKYETQMEECIEYYFSNDLWKDLEGNAKHFSDYHLEQRRYKKAHYYLNIGYLAMKKIYKERLQ
ncbi:helix-turn-helix transcriptional regulator [Evansella tamaricis]|uniref:Helix-turn-helix transcriptional regulator n=1 Tax=Evansella tamaricis TaxID=2069301 RepID=A0ABS6JIV7_9BACI|nr:helix-turn-helix transcriptional regulator [Evansella tamaricis]MBU9713611.1 helix-turn-helix transcriptional regulator [Evansella tamaricis]